MSKNFIRVLIIVSIITLTPLWSVAVERVTKISSFEIEGNDRFSDRDILQAMKSTAGKTFSPDVLQQDVSRILQLYREAGYLTSELRDPELIFNKDSSQVIISLQIAEGQEQKVGTIDISGNSQFRDEKIIDLFDTRSNRPYNDAVLERDIERLLHVYENNGYPFCRVEPGRFQMNEEQNVDLILNIVEGPRIWFGDVFVTGNKLTKSHIVIRETRMKKGELYKQAKIDAAQKRLERLGYFSKVSPLSVELVDEDTVNIVVEIEEEKSNMINGLVGYNPAQENQEGYISGLIDLSLSNLLGTGRKVDALWHRRDPFSSNLSFGYEEPWIFGIPLRGGVTLDQIDQDSSYVLTRAGLSIRAELGHNLSGSLRLGWERVVPDSTGGMFLARSTKYTAEVQAAYDTRDNPRNPKRGLSYRTSVEYGRKRNQATPYVSPERLKVRTSKFTLDLEHFIPTFPIQTIAVALHGREFRSGEKPVPVSEHFRLGGTNSLRGYREDQFTGTRVAWSNIEYRYLLTSSSRVYLFFDYGMYFREQFVADMKELEKIEKKTYGYGFGLRLESRLGIVGLDFGLGEGDSFNQGKIHFRLENRF